MAIDSYIHQRREICNLCLYKEKRDIIGMVCTKCGCNITSKTALPLSSCPENKWFSIYGLDNG